MVHNIIKLPIDDENIFSFIISSTFKKKNSNLSTKENYCLIMIDTSYIIYSKSNKHVGRVTQ